MTRNVAASVRARLANEARTTNRPFQEVLQHYGLERFLYRLAQSPHRARFVLKGALLLRVWDVSVSVAASRIKEDSEYHGVRVTFTAFLERARIPMQLDVGFGDVVHPPAEEGKYPTLLDFPAPQLQMYPRETVVAEKFEAMVSARDTE